PDRVRVAAVCDPRGNPVAQGRSWHPDGGRGFRRDLRGPPERMAPRALGRGARPEPAARLPAGTRYLAGQRGRAVEGARRLPASRVDGSRTHVTARARAFRTVRAGAEDHAEDVDPGLSARAAGPGPLHAKLAAGGHIAVFRRVGGLSAGDRRGPRLHDGRQLRAHPLAAFDQASAPDVEDIRAAPDDRPLDPPRP